jgi:N,N'-diacetyllegionaminate synthase
MSFGDQLKVKEYADSVGIEFFSTPFDYESLDFLLDDLKVNRVKIASFDVTNTGFLDYIGNRNPLNIIMSSGMADTRDIDTAIDHLKPVDHDRSSLTILHCVSAYPLEPQDANLKAIKSLRVLYPEHQIGYSDHTDDILVPSLSVLAGAQVIEKHFTLDKNGPGVDNPVSATPSMMKEMMSQIRTFESILGDGFVGMSDAEKGTEQFRRKS